MKILRVSAWALASVLAMAAGDSSAQAGITVQPGTTPTGTIGSNKGSVGPVQCPAGTLLRGVRHVDKAMDVPLTYVRGMTSQLGLYCAGVSTDGTAVIVTPTTDAGTPAVPGFAYAAPGTVQNGYCPAGQIAHQFGGWDRTVTAGNPYNVPWVSAVQLVCRPLQLNANSWVRVNTGAAGSLQPAGVRETNATHDFRGPFCSGAADTMVSGYHRQSGGEGYDGINIYCGGIRQARFSAAMTFTDFSWNRALGGTGWTVNLQRSGTMLDDGANNDGSGRTPHAGLAANTNVWQSGSEIYVIPNSGYGAVIGQRPSGIAANTFVTTGTCLGAGITLGNEVDASCTLEINGRPDIRVAIETPAEVYTAYGQTRNVTVRAVNMGPGDVLARDRFILTVTLPAGWVATAVPGCTVAGQVVSCGITSTLAGSPAPGGEGGGLAFTFPVSVQSPTDPGTYPVRLVLDRSFPDGDADATNNDYDTANDTASGNLVLQLQADLSITKDNASTALLSGAQTVYTIVVRNNGPAAAGNAVIRDPPPVGMTCQSVSCSGAGGAVCPAMSVAALQSDAGVTVATFPANSALTLSLTCTVN